MATGLIFKIFIWYWNAVDLQCCVLGVQQPDSVRQRHRFILFWILFPYRLLQSVEESPLGCVALTICFIFRRAYILIPDGSMRDTGGEGLTPGSGRSLRRRNGSSLQYSCWRTPWTEEPGRLQSMESQRVRHDWMIKYTSESQPPNLSLPPGFFFFFLAMLQGTWNLVLWPGIESVSPALEVPSLHHWTAREVPGFVYFLNEFLVPCMGNLAGKGTEACSCVIHILFHSWYFSVHPHLKTVIKVLAWGPVQRWLAAPREALGADRPPSASAHPWFFSGGPQTQLLHF